MVFKQKMKFHVGSWFNKKQNWSLKKNKIGFRCKLSEKRTKQEDLNIL
jgi:hypothetical protein